MGAFSEAKYAKVRCGVVRCSSPPLLLMRLGAHSPACLTTQPAPIRSRRWSCAGSSTPGTGRRTSRGPHAPTPAVSCDGLAQSDVAARHAAHPASPCSPTLLAECLCTRRPACQPHRGTRPVLHPSLATVCCVAAFCSCCVSYHLRKRQLRGDMSRYIWCGRGVVRASKQLQPCKCCWESCVCCQVLLRTHSGTQPAALLPLVQLQRRLAVLRPLRRAVLSSAVPVPGGGLGLGRLRASCCRTLICLCMMPAACYACLPAAESLPARYLAPLASAPTPRCRRCRAALRSRWPRPAGPSRTRCTCRTREGGLCVFVLCGPGCRLAACGAGQWARCRDLQLPLCGQAALVSDPWSAAPCCWPCCRQCDNCIIGAPCTAGRGLLRKISAAWLDCVRPRSSASSCHLLH